jgi:hypothetical protein
MTLSMAEGRPTRSKTETVTHTISAWLQRYLENRRRSFIERQAIQHLRRLEPYMLDDAGVDRESLFGPLARICEAHPAIMAGTPLGHISRQQ